MTATHAIIGATHWLITLRPVGTNSQLLHLLRELSHHLRESRPLGGGDPLQAKALLLDTEIRQHQLNGFRAFFGFVIALLVVTIAMMTAANEDAVRPLGERVNDQVGMHHARTHDPDDPNAGRILGAGNACQVGAGIGAPVTAQGDD